MEPDPTIHTITSSLPLRMGTVNCYLLEERGRFWLIDTGPPNRRREITRRLEEAGCHPGSLMAIVLTHGDFDHTGNAAYFRMKFGAAVRMHPGDIGMAENGNMFYNRRQPNVLLRMAIPFLFGFGPKERFTPDQTLADGSDLSDLGLEAEILSLPGHSKGSVGILLAGGDLFCGDLLTNIREPALNEIIDHPVDAAASVERLAARMIGTVFPGHGRSFPMEAFTRV